MNVTVALTCHFVSTPDRKIWTQTMFPYSFWKRYLEVFDHVNVVARVKRLQALPLLSQWHRSDGPNVSFLALPDFRGPEQYILNSYAVRKKLKNLNISNDAFILRLPSWVATCVYKELRGNSQPFGVEVVGDPYDVFSPGTQHNLFRGLWRFVLTNNLKRQCLAASAISYVTREALQRRYPAKPNAYSTYFSDVDLPDVFFAKESRKVCDAKKQSTLIFVGSLGHLYKAPDILIEAVKSCVAKKGLDLKLVLVGDGKERKGLESRVSAMGLNPTVDFAGQLPAGDAVQAKLDKADLFVLPSRQEGLPRAMIEAMARGLPCIGSSVGGIPELLSADDIVPPGNADELANKIFEIINDPQRMAQMSARNLEQAKEYREENLRIRRLPFYQSIKEQKNDWLISKKC